MAWLLRNSGNGYAYETMERVVAKKNTNVYLEAMEEAENKSGKPEEIGYARLAGLQKRKHSKRLLGCCRKWYITSYHLCFGQTSTNVFWARLEVCIFGASLGYTVRLKAYLTLVLWPLTIRHLRSKFKVRTGLIFLTIWPPIEPA